MVTKINRNELIQLISTKRNLVLLEALPAKYYEEGHLPGALHMPHDHVTALAPQLIPSKETPVAVYCANKNCQNSLIAAERLVKLGYTQVFAYEDGKQDWIDAGLPIEKAEVAAA